MPPRRRRSERLDYPGPWETFRRAFVAIRIECARIVGRYGLLYTEYRALTVCRAGPVTPGFLALDLGVTAAAATGIVARLRRRGWVRTRPHPRDRRATWVELTPAGRRREHASRRAWTTRLQQISSDLDAEELAAFERSLRAVDLVLRETSLSPTARR